jgi:hypothetical protein
MASNYNALPRPAAAIVTDASAHLIRNRDSASGLLASEIDSEGSTQRFRFESG